MVKVKNIFGHWSDDHSDWSDDYDREMFQNYDRSDRENTWTVVKRDNNVTLWIGLGLGFLMMVVLIGFYFYRLYHAKQIRTRAIQRQQNQQAAQLQATVNPVYPVIKEPSYQLDEPPAYNFPVSENFTTHPPAGMPLAGTTPSGQN